MNPLTIRNNNNYGLSILDDMLNGWGDIFSNRDFLEARDSHSPIVKQLDDRFEVSLAAPGIEKKDFTITVEGDNLTIAYNVGDTTNHYASATNYTKSYKLPSYSDVENICATYKNGVLVVTVPKTEAATARVIKIK